ncbi:MAG: sulfotransferase family protein [Geminicoccaceae bacterium]
MSNERPEPSFVIIGAAKAATTWLQSNLRRDQRVFMPGPEIHFFSREYDKGWDWYLKHFKEASPGQLVGEKSNSYLDAPDAAERLHQHLPNARLIVQIRNPVDRAYSDYCMLFRRGEVSGKIDDYFNGNQFESNRFYEGGRYFAHINRFLELFPKDRLLITLYNQIAEDPESLIDEVGTFLGVPDINDGVVIQERVKDKRRPMLPKPLQYVAHSIAPIIKPIRHKPWVEKTRALLAREIRYPPLPPTVEERLKDFFAADIEALSGITDKPVGNWLTDQPKRHASR